MEMVDGFTIKTALGLEDFKYIWIEKVINSPIDIFILTIDSRHPNVFLSMSRVKKTKGTVLRNLQPSLDNKAFKTTPPIELEDSVYSLKSNSLFIIRDIAGDYWRDPTMFDKSYPKIKKKSPKEYSRLAQIATNIAMGSMGMPGLGVFECENKEGKLEFSEVYKRKSNSIRN